MTAVLIMGAVLLAVMGMILPGGQISAGIVVTGCACFLGILARLNQAHDDHKETMLRLDLIFKQLMEGKGGRQR